MSILKMTYQYVTLQDCKGTKIRVLLQHGELRLDIVRNAFPEMREIFYVSNNDNVPTILKKENGVVLPPQSVTWDSDHGYVVVADDEGYKPGCRPVAGSCNWTTWSQVISTSIVTGPSLLNTTLSNLMDNGYSVVCGIQVENWTRFPLSNPMTTLEWGYLSSPATTIHPATREAMVGHKCGFTATGTSGSASWLINGSNRRFVIMWSAPFNFDFYSNYFALGLTKKGCKIHNKEWFKTMYYKSDNTDLKFNTNKYRDTSNELVVEDDEFDISGIMGTSHKPEIKVIVKPKTWENLAPKLQKS